MERLTERSSFSGLVLVRGRGLGRAYFAEDRDYKDYCDALNRLAAYEDTGLEPEQIKNLKTGIIPAHWGEMFQAEAEGRLVVLPCKVGERVYKVVKTWGTVPICCPCGEYRGMQKCSYFKENGNVSECTAEMQADADGFINGVVSLMFGYDMLPEIGKSVFLTRDEAEAKLKQEVESDV